MDERLRAELLARRDEDQRIRGVLARWRGTGALPAEVAAEWQRVDEGNTVWLGRIVGAMGWPGRSLVGEDGTHAACLLAQHADRLPQLQRLFLGALNGAVAEGEAPARALAYLEDRVLTNNGLDQVYGTQFTGAGEELAPYPIDDPENLDERRAAVGLEPFAEYAARLRAR